MVKCYTKQRKDGSTYTTCNKDIKENKPKPKPKPKPSIDKDLFLDVSKVLSDVGRRKFEEKYKVIKEKVLLRDIGTNKGQFIINSDYGTIGWPSGITGRYFKTVAEFIKAEKKELKDFLKKNPKSKLILDKKRNKYYITTIEQINKSFSPYKQLKIYVYFK